MFLMNSKQILIEVNGSLAQACAIRCGVLRGIQVSIVLLFLVCSGFFRD